MLFDLTARLPKKNSTQISLFTPLQEIWDLHHVWKKWKTSCHSNGALIVIYHGTISKNSPTKRQKNPPTLKPSWGHSFTPWCRNSGDLRSFRSSPPGASNQSFELPDTDCDGVPVIASTWKTRIFVDQLLQGDLVWSCLRSEVTSISGIKRSRWRIWELQSEQMKLKLHLVFCPKDPKGFRVYLFFLRYRTFKLRFRGLRTAVCDGLNMALHPYIACKHE